MSTFDTPLLQRERLGLRSRLRGGTMVVDIIGSKDKVDVSWDYMTSADLRLLAQEIKNGMFVTISYNTAEQEEIKTITARAESLSYMELRLDKAKTHVAKYIYKFCREIVSCLLK